MSGAVAGLRTYSDALVDAIQSHQQELGKRFGELDRRMESGEATLATLVTSVVALKADVADLRADVRRLLDALGVKQAG